MRAGEDSPALLVIRFLLLLTTSQDYGRVSSRQVRSLICDEHDDTRTRSCGPCLPRPCSRGSREIFSVGAAFHRLNLAKRLERSEHKVREFEARYHTHLAQPKRTAPDDADYAMHEDYIEWHYWSRVLRADSESAEYPLSTLPSGWSRA